MQRCGDRQSGLSRNGEADADAFSMMEQVLGEGAADQVLTCGLNGEVMLLAQGHRLGVPTEPLIDDKGLTPLVARARDWLARYGDRILFPHDVVVEAGRRKQLTTAELPVEAPMVDVGEQTIARYIEIINQAAAIFVNGPAGIYENPVSAMGTERLRNAIADAPGSSVIGGGDSVAAGAKFNVLERIGYVCTSDGGMVRFLSGQELPVIAALRRAAKRYQKGHR